MKKGSIGFNTVIYSASSIIVKAASFLSLYLLTYLLEPLEYGIITIFQSLLSVGMILFSMNIGLSIVRKYYEGDDQFNEFYNYAVNFFFKVFGLASLVFVVLCFIWTSSIPLWMQLALIPICFFQFFIGTYKSIEIAKANSIEVSLLDIGLKILVIVLPIGGILLFELNTFGWLVGFLVSYLIVWIYCTKRSSVPIKVFEHVNNKAYYQYIKDFSFPLVLYSLSSVVLDFIDRIMIGEMLGYASAGIYSYSYNIGFIVLVLRQAILNAQRPVYYKLMNDSDFEQADHLSLVALKKVLFIVLLIVLFYPELGSMMAGKESYKEGLIVIPLISVAYLFHTYYQILSRQLMYSKKTRWISIGVYVTGVINVLLNWCFLPKYGIVFGAISTLISYIILPLFLYFVLKLVEKKIHVPKLNTSVLESFLYLIIISCLIYLFSLFSLNLFLSILVKLCIGVLFFLALKPFDILLFFNLLKKSN